MAYMFCQAEGCEKPLTGRYSKWCLLHRSRLARNGDIKQLSLRTRTVRSWIPEVQRARDLMGHLELPRFDGRVGA